MELLKELLNLCEMTTLGPKDHEFGMAGEEIPLEKPSINDTRL